MHRRSINARLAVLGIAMASVWVAFDSNAEVMPDRTAVRFTAPETGGPGRPRFFTEREIGLFARLEAMMEGVPLQPGEYPERYVRSATDRLVARAMLASLMIQRGTEPPDLPALATDARAELADRVGGPQALTKALEREGIDDAELQAFLFDQVRAEFYIDKGIGPIFAITDDAVREAYRSSLHPFKALKFEDARARLKRWVIAERARAAELEFLQTARARTKIVTVLGNQR